MFVLTYKSNTNSPTMSEAKIPKSINTSTTLSDIVSEDVSDLKFELNQHNASVVQQCGEYKSIVYPIEDIIRKCNTNLQPSDLLSRELAYIASSLTNKPVSDVTIQSIDAFKSQQHSGIDILYITNINSRNQLSKLSNISASYQSVYLVKPRLDDPFSERVYAILIGTSTSDVKPSKLIYRLSSVIDLALAIYSQMIYCSNLAKTISSFDEGTRPSLVRLPNISLKPAQEYQFYIDGLVNYCQTIVN